MCITTHLVCNQKALDICLTAAHVNVLYLEAKGTTGWITFQPKVESPTTTIIRPARAPSVSILQGWLTTSFGLAYSSQQFLMFHQKG